MKRILTKLMVIFGIIFTLCIFSIGVDTQRVAYASDGLEPFNSMDQVQVDNELILSTLIKKVTTDFSQAVSATKLVYGFNGDIYWVVESEPTGYVIYHPSSGTFVETSKTSLSPYYGITGCELFYGGPTYYYQKVGGVLKHTIIGNDVEDCEYKLLLSQSVNITRTLNESPNLNWLNALQEINTAQVYTNQENVAIANVSALNTTSESGYYWFKNLSNFGRMDGGNCGFIALNMLYGYLDKFYDDKYLPNQYWTDATKSALKAYDDSFSKYLYELDPKDGTTNIHIHKVSKQYLKNNNITDIKHLSLVLPTRAHVANCIDAGYPAIIFGNLSHSENIPSSNRDAGNHAVVAYGYNRSTTDNSIESFVVHYGWSGYSEVTMANTLANLYGGMYAMQVNSGHAHNFVNTAQYMLDGNDVYGVEKCTICNIEEPVDAFHYVDLGNNEVEIDNFLPKSFTGDVFFNEKWHGKKVVAIGDYAFKDSQLKNITIPYSITTVGKYSFQNCTNLSCVNLLTGGNLSSIGEGAFYGCSALTSVSIPSTTTAIGDYTFQKCTNLSSVTIPTSGNLSSIGNGAFYGCSSLTSISIPSATSSIGDYAFRNCTSLSTVNFAVNGKGNNSLSSLGRGAFLGCTALNTISTLPSGVLKIEAETFDGCSSLTSVSIPSTTRSIDDYAFRNCTILSSVTIQTSGSLSSVGNGAFLGCTALNSISLPSGVTEIGFEAFESNTVLTNFTGNRSDINLVIVSGEKDTYVENGWDGFNILKIVLVTYFLAHRLAMANLSKASMRYNDGMRLA